MIFDLCGYLTHFKVNELENYCETLSFNLFIELDYDDAKAVVLFKFEFDDCNNNEGFDNDF